MHSPRRFSVVFGLAAFVAIGSFAIAADGDDAPAPAPETTEAAEAEAARPDDAAIREALRVVAGQPLPDPRREGPPPRDPEVQAAWRTLRLAGEDAVPIVKEGLAQMDNFIAAVNMRDKNRAGDQANLFRIVAASVLYQAAGLDEAETIAELWRQAGPGRTYLPRQVYGTAYRAALSGDKRAYPMLVALLTDTQNGMRFRRGEGQSPIDWPDTHEVIWAAAGADAEPTLLAVFDNPAADESTLASAVWVATRQASTAALPAIRKLAAREGAGFAKCAAIEALGVFGHPDDFAGLREGIAAATALPLDNSDRGALLAAYVDALAEFGDLRAGADLWPLLKDGDVDLHKHTRELLIYMLTPEGLAKLRAGVAELKGGERADADAAAARLFAEMGVPANEYDAADEAERREIVKRFRDGLQADYTVDPDEELPAEVTLADLLAAVATERSATLPDELSWVKPRHVLRLALAAGDAGELRASFLAARQALASSLGADTVEDLDVVSAVMIRLARAAYREPLGFGEEVGPVKSE